MITLQAIKYRYCFIIASQRPEKEAEGSKSNKQKQGRMTPSDKSAHRWRTELEQAAEQTRKAYRDYNQAKKEEAKAIKLAQETNHSTDPRTQALLKQQAEQAGATAQALFRRYQEAQQWEQAAKEAARESQIV
mgnify:FL=1